MGLPGSRVGLLGEVVEYSAACSGGSKNGLPPGIIRFHLGELCGFIHVHFMTSRLTGKGF